MTKLLCILIVVFVNSTSYSKCTDKPVRIAVIDTGFGFKGRGEDARLCPDGHQDFTTDQQFSDPTGKGLKIPLDIHGHGTNVTGIIENFARLGHVNYCIVVIKYFISRKNNLQADIESFKYVSKNNISYVNFSSGGSGQNIDERLAVRDILNRGITMVVAAGNEGHNLDFPIYNYYPAQYDKRLIVVGSVNKNGARLSTSNYGKVVDRWEIGESVVGYGISMTGTSQATATATGKIVAENPNKCER